MALPLALTLMASGAQLGGTIMDYIKGSKTTKEASRAYEDYINQINIMYGQRKKQYAPGGAFERKGLYDIEQAKTTTTGTAMSRMIASGLTGGETGLGMEAAWDKGVGIPARLTLEDLRLQRLNEIRREHQSLLAGQAGTSLDLAKQAGAAMPSWSQMIGQGVGLAGQLYSPGGGAGFGGGLGGAKAATPAAQVPQSPPWQTNNYLWPNK